MKIIDGQEKYNEIFSEKLSFNKIETVREKALLHALDIRKFEIDLYWKRATYFWAFIAAAFAGYFALLSSDSPPPKETFVLLNCIGLIFSLTWYFVNRGSKFWQNNWERHVDLLENEIMGPLYKTAIDIHTCNFWKLQKEYPFSVSKINQLLSLYVLLIWIFLTIQSLNEIYDIREPFKGTNSIIIVASTIVFIYILFTKAKTEQEPASKDLKAETKRLIIRTSFFEK